MPLEQLSPPCCLPPSIPMHRLEVAPQLGEERPWRASASVRGAGRRQNGRSCNTNPSVSRRGSGSTPLGSSWGGSSLARQLRGRQDPRESTGPLQRGAPDEPPKEPLCGPLRSPYFCPLLRASQSPSLHTQWDPLGRVELRALHFFLRRESGNFLFYAMVSGE